MWGLRIMIFQSHCLNGFTNYMPLGIQFFFFLDQIRVIDYFSILRYISRRVIKLIRFSIDILLFM